MRLARATFLAALGFASVAACGETASDSGSSPDASTLDGAIGDAAITDAIVSDDGPHVLADGGAIAAPRLVSPLDTATVSSQKPTITWILPAGVTGAHVEICKDRACTTIETSFDASGSSGAPSTALTPGVHFFRAAGQVGSSVGNPRSATWEMLIGHHTAARDASWGSFPDFDGDGLADVMAAGGAQSNGSYDVQIFPGNRLGPANANSVYVTDPSRQADDNFPRATFGDVDGDGFSDLVVGNITTTPSKDQNNRISIYRGNSAGFTHASVPDWVLHVPPPTTDGGPEYTYFGATVTVPGDVNGDGYADIAVQTIVTGSVTGPTLIFFGHANGPSKTPDAALDGEGTAYQIAPAGPVGDVDGDGYADLILTAGDYGVWLFLGGPSGPSDATRHQLTAPASSVSGELGRISNGAGDLDGDGFPDIVVTAMIAPRGDGGSVGPGQAYVYRGATGPDLFVSDWTLTGPDDNGGNFGGASAIVGDTDGDGYDDLIVGAAQVSSNAGRAYYYRGSSSGVSDSVRVTLSGPGGGGWFGGAAQAGDLDGDGLVDSIVAASVYGEIFIFYGRSTGLSDVSTQTTLSSPGFLYILAESLRSPMLRGPT